VEHHTVNKSGQVIVTCTRDYRYGVGGEKMSGSKFETYNLVAALFALAACFVYKIGGIGPAIIPAIASVRFAVEASIRSSRID
jgi:hypothetical protein